MDENDKKKYKKNHLHGECILKKIIFILYTRIVPISYYLKMSLICVFGPLSI